MARDRSGQRVTITGGMSEFVGRTGTIVALERCGSQRLYRVRLDEPVRIPHVGLVEDDLWEGQYLRTLRTRMTR